LRWNGFVRKSRQLMYLRGVSNLTRFKLSWHLVVSKQWQTLFSGNIECVNLKMDRRTMILLSTPYIDFIFYLIVLTVNVPCPVSALIMQNLYYGRVSLICYHKSDPWQLKKKKKLNWQMVVSIRTSIVYCVTIAVKDGWRRSMFNDPCRQARDQCHACFNVEVVDQIKQIGVLQCWWPCCLNTSHNFVNNPRC
jgi:hypothetical protein